MKRLEVGDKVLYRRTYARGGDWTEAEVVKVGRVWATVCAVGDEPHRYNVYRFAIDRWYPHEQNSGYRLSTAEREAEAGSRAELIEAMKNAGWDVRYSSHSVADYSLDQLRRAVAIFTEGTP